MGAYDQVDLLLETLCSSDGTSVLRSSSMITQSQCYCEGCEGRPEDAHKGVAIPKAQVKAAPPRHLFPAPVATNLNPPILGLSVFTAKEE
jgi:hypothetical protein